VIEADAWLGVGVTVLPGVTVGRGAVVGAHSVVHKDVAPLQVVAGRPAGPVRTLEPPAGWS
jgi:acetyltransferase-like isoleucine patch superfamily enzyme